jgi:hypothetical protein
VASAATALPAPSSSPTTKVASKPPKVRLSNSSKARARR